MGEKEKPSGKPEKRYTRKQIYDDATDHDILRNTWKILKREFRG